MDVNLRFNAVSTASTSLPGDPAGVVGQTESIGSTSASTTQSATTDINGAVKLIEQYLKASQRDLEFSIDQVRGVPVVKVVSTETGQVIRQMPTEEALKLADSLSKNQGSVLFDGKV